MVLTCGSFASGAEAVRELLLAAGLRPEPTAAGLSDAAPWVEQVPAAELDGALAARPAAGFVLVYSSPQHAVAAALSAGPVDRTKVDQVLDAWVLANTALLRFHARSHGRSVLLNGHALQLAPAEGLNAIAVAFGMQFATPTNFTWPPDDQTAVASALATAWVAEHAEAFPLYLELDSMASIEVDGRQLQRLERERGWTLQSSLYAALVESGREAAELGRLLASGRAAAESAAQQAEERAGLLAEAERRLQAQALELEARQRQSEQLQHALDAQSRLAADRQLELEQAALQLASTAEGLEREIVARMAAVALATEREVQWRYQADELDRLGRALAECQVQLDPLRESVLQRDQESLLAADRLATLQAQLLMATQAGDASVQRADDTQAALNALQAELQRLQLDRDERMLELAKQGQMLSGTLVETRTALELRTQSESQLRETNQLLKLQLQQLQADLEGMFLKQQALRDEQQKAQSQLTEASGARDAQAKLVKEGQAELLRVQVRLADATKAHEGQAKAAQVELQKLRTAHQQLQADLADQQKAREVQAQLVRDRQAEAQKLRAEQQQVQTDLAGQRQESALLLEQIQQLQDELSHCYLQAQDEGATNSLAAKQYQALKNIFRSSQPADVVIDLCGHIDGTQWHEAEPDGRWAGPGLSSTLRFPGLRPGLYSLQLDVVDAMLPEVVAGMQAKLNNKQINLDIDLDGGYPALILGSFEESDEALDQWQLELTWPVAVAPAERGEADTRKLAARLRSVTLSWLDGGLQP